MSNTRRGLLTALRDEFSRGDRTEGHGGLHTYWFDVEVGGPVTEDHIEALSDLLTGAGKSTRSSRRASAAGP